MTRLAARPDREGGAGVGHARRAHLGRRDRLRLLVLAGNAVSRATAFAAMSDE